MAQFITRIELHGVRHDDDSYQLLHDAMEASGFKRTIADDNTKTYHLLPAEYEVTGNYTTQSVMISAKEATSHTNKKYSIFVSEIIRATWYNLKAV